MVEFDNRHFWMKLKKLLSSHFANYAEAYAANKLLNQGRVQPLLTATYDLEHVGDAALSVHHNEAEGKLGVLCLAPEKNMGIDDPAKRERIALRLLEAGGGLQRRNGAAGRTFGRRRRLVHGLRVRRGAGGVAVLGEAHPAAADGDDER